MKASPITSTNSARSRSPAEMMSQAAVMAGLTASELATESTTALPIRRLASRVSSVAPRIPPPAAISASRRHPFAR